MRVVLISCSPSVDQSKDSTKLNFLKILTLKTLKLFSWFLSLVCHSILISQLMQTPLILNLKTSKEIKVKALNKKVNL